MVQQEGHVLEGHDSALRKEGRGRRTRELIKRCLKSEFVWCANVIAKESGQSGLKDNGRDG